MSRMRFSSGVSRSVVTGTLLLAVAACAGRQDADRAEVAYKGTDPQAGSPAAVSPEAAAPATAPGSRGIVSYQGYQAAVARRGDTVASIADRLGLSATELAAYNGLTPEHELRAGDELVLPPRDGGYGSGQPAAEAGTQVARAEPTSEPMTAPEAPTTGPGEAQTDIEAAPLETAPTAQAGEGTGWSPDLAAAAIDRWQAFDEEGNLAPPPSAEAPLPPDPEPAPELASPQLDQYQTQVGTGTPPAPRPVETISTPAEQPAEQPAEEPVEEAAAEAEPEPAPEPAETEPAETELAAISPSDGELRLMRPAQGPIVVGYGQGGGRARNDGVDFASPAGSPVVAAADGEVALVSQSLGGLGTILLVRHPGDYLTVYGRIDNVTVGKGDIVSQGQKIGVVASNPTPRMHFEVRKGAESLNPERFF